MPPAFHRIRFIPGNKFAHSIGVNIDETPLVLTSHHQSIDRLGAQLKAAATSMDGKIVEAIEHKKFPNVFGVQFHPEHYLLYQKGRTLRKEPDGEEEINIRHFLINNHNSFKFHQKLWNWFSRNIAKSRR